MHTPMPAVLTPRVTTRTYPGTPDQVRQVRADLRQVLADCPIADDVILCVSELAANAVLHSNSGRPGGTFTVRLLVQADGLTAEVEDQGGPWKPQRDPQKPGGRGLWIVSQLTSYWDISGESTTGRTVRFGMDLQ